MSEEMIIPRGVLWGAAAAIALALSGAAAVRFGWLPVLASPAAERAELQAQPIAARDLRFVDGADGSVMVVTMDGQQLTAVQPYSENGFIRGVMRGMARERHLQGIGADAPFRLTLWSNDSLTLSDPSTGREIELSGFGPVNRAAFADLLNLSKGTA